MSEVDIENKGIINLALTSLKGFASKIKNSISLSPFLLYLIFATLVAGFLLLFISILVKKGNDILVEVFGFLLDIVLFGVILAYYNNWRERRTKIRDYHDQLDDFRSWKTEEGVLRKTGIIRRLNSMGAPLPRLYSIVLTMAELNEAELANANLFGAQLDEAQLTKANLKNANLVGASLIGAVLIFVSLEGAWLEGAKLESAQLNMANLSGAHLKGADLWGAHLEGADLTDAEGLTWAQLKATYWDKKTIFPNYLKPEDMPEGTGREPT